MDVKVLRGIAVVTIENGEKIGAVKDVLFDPDNRRVHGFTLGGGLLRGDSHVIQMADIQSIGSDAIMIPDRRSMHGERGDDRNRAFPDLSDVTSLRVVTRSGTYVGNLSSVLIDESTGAMTDVEISPGGLTSAFKSKISVPISLVVSIGKDVVIIPDDYVEQTTPQEAQESGGERTDETPVT